MSPSEIISLFSSVGSMISSIGACGAALVALFTLRELKRQRIASHQPKLVLTRIPFVIKFQSEDEFETGVWGLWNPNEEEDENTSNNLVSIINAHLLNIGNGAAKDVSITWSFNHDKVISKINEISQKNMFNFYIEKSKDHLMEINRGKEKSYHSHTINMNTFMEYITPAHWGKTLFHISIPYGYIVLSSSYMYVAIKKNNKDKNSTLSFDDNILRAWIHIKYTDINEIICSANFEMNIEIHSITTHDDKDKSPLKIDGSILFKRKSETYS